MPGAQQRDRLRPVAHVDDRLRGRGADAGLGPQHAVADREHPRLHRAADLAGGRIEAENRERRHRIRARRARCPRRQRAATPGPAASIAAIRQLPSWSSASPRHPVGHSSSQTAWQAASATSAIDDARSVRAPSRTGVHPAAARLALPRRSSRPRGRPRASPHPARRRRASAAGLRRRSAPARPARAAPGRARRRRTCANVRRRIDRRHDRAPALLRRRHRDPLPALRGAIRAAASPAAPPPAPRRTGRTRATPIITASRIMSSVASPFSTAAASV